MVQLFAHALKGLRRRKWKPRWEAGTWTLEVTNEGRGWHLHTHLLVESRWVDAQQLARRWAHQVGVDDFCIVKVKDCRATEYCHEVAKYVCKPAQLTSWKPVEIVQVMDAFKGRRVFGVFGRLAKERQHWKAVLKEVRANRSKCPCGQNDWKVENETQRVENFEREKERAEASSLNARYEAGNQRPAVSAQRLPGVG
jgi:hypothetical protein